MDVCACLANRNVYLHCRHKEKIAVAAKAKEEEKLDLVHHHELMLQVKISYTIVIFQGSPLLLECARGGRYQPADCLSAPGKTGTATATT